MRYDDPIHHPTASLLSYSSGHNDFRGFVTLAFILLVLSSVRIALDNLFKHGLIGSPIVSFLVLLGRDQKSYILGIALFSLTIVLLTLLLERHLIENKHVQSLVGWVHILNLTLFLVVPALVIFWVRPHPITSFFTVFLQSIGFLKLYSYISVNFWCRNKIFTGEGNAEIPKPEKSLVKYPDNLNLRDLVYFLLAPTLCYELNFPRKSQINYSFLLRRLFEMVFLSYVIVFLTQQWLHPVFFQTPSLGQIPWKVVKIAVPNHLIHLVGFYVFFHSYLNFTAELLGFEDRSFYGDWWNSPGLRVFWKTWNLPVYRWGYRHLFLPLTRRGYSGVTASLAVFLVSAFFHEYLVSVPLNLPRVSAFLSMISQIPQMYLTDRYCSPLAGNVIMWLNLIVGVPLVMTFYIYDYLTL